MAPRSRPSERRGADHGRARAARRDRRKSASARRGRHAPARRQGPADRSLPPPPLWGRSRRACSTPCSCVAQSGRGRPVAGRARRNADRICARELGAPHRGTARIPRRSDRDRRPVCPAGISARGRHDVRRRRQRAVGGRPHRTGRFPRRARGGRTPAASQSRRRRDIGLPHRPSGRAVGLPQHPAGRQPGARCSRRVDACQCGGTSDDRVRERPAGPVAPRRGAAGANRSAGRGARRRARADGSGSGRSQPSERWRAAPPARNREPQSPPSRRSDEGRLSRPPTPSSPRRRCDATPAHDRDRPADRGTDAEHGPAGEWIGIATRAETGRRSAPRVGGSRLRSHQGRAARRAWARVRRSA